MFADPEVVHETLFLRDFSRTTSTADGNPDLAFLDSELDTVTVRLGRGDGTFGTRIRTPVENPNGVMDTADFDHDGAVDVVIPATTDDGVTVLRGRGNGRFRDPSSSATVDWTIRGNWWTSTATDGSTSFCTTRTRG